MLKKGNFLLVLFLLFLSFSIYPSIVFASSYEYIDPVDVLKPTRSPPVESELNAPEDKSANKFSNDIDQDPVTCTLDMTVSENKTPDQENITDENGNIVSTFWQYIKTLITELSQDKSNPREYTNYSYRDSHLQYAKDPPVDFKATPEEDAKKFKNYHLEAQNASVRSLPRAQRLVIKGKHIEEAVISLPESSNIIPVDEQLAWDCNNNCDILFDETKTKPSGCRPIYISEVGYYYYTHGIPTSYILKDNLAVPTQIDSRAVDVYNKYQTYRPTFTQFVSDPKCYEKLYINMPVQPRGTVNTKFIIYNVNEDGSVAPTPVYRALPLAAPMSSQEYDQTIQMAMPNKNVIEAQGNPEPNQICESMRPNPSMKDLTSVFNIFTFIRNLYEWITNPTTFNKTIKVDAIFPPQMVTNIKEDETMIASLIPQKNHDIMNFKTITKSSQKSDYPDPGLKQAKQRTFFSQIIKPKNWQLYNPRPEEPGDTSIPTSIAPDVNQWCSLIKKYAIAKNLDPALIAAQMTVESGGNPNAISSQGAVGLLQIMPSDNTKGFVANCNGNSCFADRPSTEELLKPEFNIDWSTTFLQKLIVNYGSVRDGLKHYGPTYSNQSRVYEYADKILSLYQKNPSACK